MKLFCEICGERALFFRRINVEGKLVIIVSRDRAHSLCRRHHSGFRESELQKQKFGKNYAK